MMYYERSLECQAFLDAATEKNLIEALGFKEMIARVSSNINEGSSRRQEEETLDDTRKRQVLVTAAMKFTYVVAAQVYGEQRKVGTNQAKGMEELWRDADAQASIEFFKKEIWRQEAKKKKLHWRHLQEMHFEEALKMRSLLQEFHKHHAVRKPTILGVREHVFTGSVSSLAWFMSAQETSFVTLGQRVLANSLKIRMHNGHPDVFNRLWLMSRGGLSKASRTINFSEDIFAGFSCTQRGGTVTHHEYIQAGKGRNAGLNQIALFESEVASGNGEQVLSRDVYRLGHILDFF